jgi:hypothetical protein
MARKGAPRHAELTLQPCSVGTERRSILSCVPPCNAWSTLQLAGKIFVQCINFCTGMFKSCLERARTGIRSRSTLGPPAHKFGRFSSITKPEGAGAGWGSELAGARLAGPSLAMHTSQMVFLSFQAPSLTCGASPRTAMEVFNEALGREHSR